MANIKGGTSNIPWEIETVSKAGRVLLYGADGNPIVYNEGDIPTNPGGILNMGLNDGMIVPMRADRFGSMGVASHTPLLTESFEGTTINTQRWTPVATTATATQSTVTGLIINSGASLAINTGYMLQSVRKIAMSQRQPMQFKYRARLEYYSNSVMELGLGDAVTFNGVNTTGAIFLYAADGTLKPTIYYNTGIQQGTNVAGLDPSKYYTFDIYKDDDQINFTIQDTTTGAIINKQVIRLNASTQRLFSSTQLSIMARVYVSGTAAPTAPKMYLTDVYASVLDATYNMQPGTIQSLMARDLVHHPLTGVQLAQFGNSSQPSSATLSNTAAGYATLGGKYQFAAPLGAVTDYALFGFQVPAPLGMVVTGIDIEAWNTGAVVAGSPTVLEWFAVANQAAVSLATGTGRVGLGAQDMPTSAAIGYRCQRLSKQYKDGLFTGSGRFFVIGLRCPIGTATASQVISGQVNLEGYFI